MAPRDYVGGYRIGDAQVLDNIFTSTAKTTYYKYDPVILGIKKLGKRGPSVWDTKIRNLPSFQNFNDLLIYM